MGEEKLTEEKNQAPDFAPYLNVRNAIMPAFSAGNRQVVFLSDITGTNQIWAVPFHSGGNWPTQLTFSEERVTGLHASPDGTAFLFSQDTGGDEQDQFYLLQGSQEEGVTITTLFKNPKTKNNFGA